jgi:TonB family protein
MRVTGTILLITLLVGSTIAADQERRIVHREDPEYPQMARKLNLHGVVKLKIWISPDGAVRRVEYIGGHPVLAEAALKAVKTGKYQPAPQETNVVVEVRF